MPEHETPAGPVDRFGDSVAVGTRVRVLCISPYERIGIEAGPGSPGATRADS